MLNYGQESSFYKYLVLPTSMPETSDKYGRTGKADADQSIELEFFIAIIHALAFCLRIS